MAIGGTVSALREAVKGGRMATWDDALGFMQENKLLEPTGDAPVSARDTYVHNSDDVLKVDGSADATTVKAIALWLHNVVGDEDVLDASAIDAAMIANLAKIVAETGAHVSSVGSAIHGKEHIERWLLDMGVVRFPDIDHPCFKVYRLQLHGWRDCDRTLAFEKNSNGLGVDFDCRKYQPCAREIERLTAAAVQDALAEAETLFD